MRQMPHSESNHVGPTAKGQRRTQRRNAVSAEQVLWSHLRNRQQMNCKFRRQHSFGSYIVDFYSKELKLAIELDGDSHFIGNAAEYDRERQIQIERYGVRFIRITNEDVFTNLDGVLHDIGETILRLRDGLGSRRYLSGESDPSP